MGESGSKTEGEMVAEEAPLLSLSRLPSPLLPRHPILHAVSERGEQGFCQGFQEREGNTGAEEEEEEAKLATSSSSSSSERSSSSFTPTGPCDSTYVFLRGETERNETNQLFPKKRQRATSPFQEETWNANCFTIAHATSAPSGRREVILVL